MSRTHHIQLAGKGALGIVGKDELDLERLWARLIEERTATSRDVFVYFKHEDEGKGPEFAARLIEALSTR